MSSGRPRLGPRGSLTLRRRTRSLTFSSVPPPAAPTGSRYDDITLDLRGQLAKPDLASSFLFFPSKQLGCWCPPLLARIAC